MSESNQLIQECSNYKRYDAYISRTRYARVPLNNITGSTLTLGLNSTTLAEWKIPAKTVFNPSKSFLTYQYQVQAGGAGLYGVVFDNNQDFAQWVYYGNGGGLGIVDVNYSDRYTSVVGPLRTSELEMSTRDAVNTLYQTNLTNTGANQNLIPFSQDGLSTGTAFNSVNPYQDIQYLRFSAANTAMTVSRQIPLSVFRDTFLACNKNVIFGTDMYLRFNTQYMSRLGFYTNSNTAPGTNANVTAFTVGTGINNSAFTNVYLYLALEENKVLVDSLMSALLAGSIKMTIPYTYTYRFSGSGTSSNISITLTRQFGHKLKRLLYAPFSSSETGQYSFDHSNVNGTKITQFQSSIDSRPLTDYMLQCYNPNSTVNPGNVWTLGTSLWGDDYREMQKFLRGSCIEDYLSYQLNWSYQDSWGLQDFIKTIHSNVPDENIDDGLNLLDADHVYTLQLNTPNIGNANMATNGSLVHYIFALFERNLAITADGISFY